MAPFMGTALHALAWTFKDEHHLVFECQPLHGVRDKFPDLFKEHAVTMVKFMWQADSHGVAKFAQNVWKCMQMLAL